YQAPKPPPERISLGLNTLRNAGQRIVIATGSGKRDALARLQAGQALPVALVEPDTWFIDKAANPDKT
ncbi:MAG TPA: 6-phosphogluconolactonase, partial [Gammaproteobacteria bacterium]|nr:6-phosphogluconolactonase [Gammaproteobacteria bacterium]